MDADFVETALLVKNGVPEARAFEMDRSERLAWLIVLGMSDGGNWDWEAMAWRKPDA